MPTGPKHARFVFVEFSPTGEREGYEEDCRCMIGVDHNAIDGDAYDDEDEDDNGEDESLPVHEAADIWMSNGKDEDYMFGYSASELESAAGG